MSFLCCVFLKESLKSGFIKKAVDKLKEVDKFLGTNQWFAGDRVSLLIQVLQFFARVVWVTKGHLTCCSQP